MGGFAYNPDFQFQMNVFVEPCSKYDPSRVQSVLDQWDGMFAQTIRPGSTVVLKPNWIAASHKYNSQEWQSVITHPIVITGVLRSVLKHLAGCGRVVITDGPQTQSSWDEIMKRMTPELWVDMGRHAGVQVDILDLRQDEWRTHRDVIVARKKLPGDPLGSTECDLHQCSEFVSHRPGPKGYFGADYDRADTNTAHGNGHHKYKVARTIIAADVFINLPKLKTHKKAGITASLKNLVGINTYKNWLPHHTEGTPDEHGDQFPASTMRTRAEGHALERTRQLLSSHTALGRVVGPLKSISKLVFGDTREVIRNGSWYGNDTIWRMILDLNKVLSYANPDGTLRSDEPAQRKRYISVVDSIIAGEGNGPEAPEPRNTGLLIGGTNPVALDAVCARVMGFDWGKIPSIRNAFGISQYRLCDFRYSDIVVVSERLGLKAPLPGAGLEKFGPFRPHFGWKDHIELHSERNERVTHAH
jgi:uncharacterized protein (DUF362 family)